MQRFRLANASPDWSRKWTKGFHQNFCGLVISRKGSGGNLFLLRSICHNPRRGNPCGCPGHGQTPSGRSGLAGNRATARVAPTGVALVKNQRQNCFLLSRLNLSAPALNLPASRECLSVSHLNLSISRLNLLVSALALKQPALNLSVSSVTPKGSREYLSVSRVALKGARVHI